MKYEFVSFEAPSNIKVNEEDLHVVERTYNFTFPSALRDYYLQHNGSQMVPCLIHQTEEEFEVRRIIPIKADGSFNLEKRLQLYRDENTMEPYMIPLGDNEGDIDFFWDSRNENVYRTYMDDTGYTLICKGVDQFFDILNNAYWRDEDSPYDITEITRRDLEMEKKEYLPLGSIVLLKEGVRKVMIIGRALNVKKGEKTYYFDYGGVLYPDGLTGDEMVYFDHDAIMRVYFHGYMDDDNDIMVENINNYVAEHPDLLRADPATWNDEV